MSQASSKSSGGGGGGIITINGDTGSVTGSTIKFDAITQAGSSVSFSGSGTIMSLNTTDSNNNTFIGLGCGGPDAVNCTGLGAGSLAATNSADAVNCTGIGVNSLATNINGAYNSAFGVNSGYGINNVAAVENMCFGGDTLFSCVSGSQNCAIGYYSAFNLVSGARNIAIGNGTGGGTDSSGVNWAGAESDNICIQNPGVLGETNTLHIGNGTGAGNGQLNASFISGIYGFTGSSGTMMVTIDNTDQLGVAAIPGGGGIVTIDGDTGSATGSTIKFDAITQAGSSVSFSGSGTTVSLNTMDAGNNVILAGGNPGIVGAGGAGNVGAGYLTFLELTSGSNNQAVGYESLALLLTGSGNLCFGSRSGFAYTSSESNNIILGQLNEGTVGESNTLRIGSGTGTGNGNLNQSFIQGIQGIAIANSAPVFIDTTTGQLGTSTTSSVSPGFLATLGATQVAVTGNGALYTIIPDTVLNDRASNYNNGTGVFTAPVTGFYHLWMSCTVVGTTIATNMQIRIQTTSNLYVNTYNRAPSSDNLNLNLSVVAPMTAGDTAFILVTCSGEVADTDDVYGDTTTQGTCFGGVFIS